MFEYDMSELNTRLVENLDNNENMSKVADIGAMFIRTRMRELSFARRILPPVPITKAELTRTLENDQLHKIIDIEPNSFAQTINFRGAPPARWINGDRYAVTFFKISTPKFQKNEIELMAYEMPITTLIESSSVKDLQAIEDEAFISGVESAITESGKTLDVTTFNTVDGLLDRIVFLKLKTLLANTGNTDTQGTHNFDAKRYVAKTILMNQEDYEKIALWNVEDAGDGYVSQAVIQGATTPMVMGAQIITTIKGELVPPGTMYAFTSREYLGHSFMLGDTKFYIDKKDDIVTWSASEYIGYGIGNAYAIAKVTWTN